MEAINEELLEKVNGVSKDNSVKFIGKEKEWLKQLNGMSDELLEKEISDKEKDTHIMELQILLMKLTLVIREKSGKIDELRKALDNVREFLRNKEG